MSKLSCLVDLNLLHVSHVTEEKFSHAYRCMHFYLCETCASRVHNRCSVKLQLRWRLQENQKPSLVLSDTTVLWHRLTVCSPSFMLFPSFHLPVSLEPHFFYSLSSSRAKACRNILGKK